MSFIPENKEIITIQKVREMSPLVLAYIGDSIYEEYIRKYLVSTGISNVNDLQKASIKYVSATGQAKYITEMIDNGFLNDEELNVFKRARNYKTTSHPKSCDIVTYKYATGLEAVIGYLELENKRERINEIMDFIISR